MIGCFGWPEYKGSIQIECQEISQSLNTKHKRCQALPAKIVVAERAMSFWTKFSLLVVSAAASTARLLWTWPLALALFERAPRFLDCARDGLALFVPHSCQSQISWHLARRSVVRKWFQKRHLWNPWPLVCSAPTAQTVFLPTVPWSGLTNQAHRKKVPWHSAQKISCKAYLVSDDDSSNFMGKRCLILLTPTFRQSHRIGHL